MPAHLRRSTTLAAAALLATGVCAPAARADAPPSPPRLSVREVHDGPQTCDVRVETMIGGTWVTTGHYGGGPALPLRGRGGLFSELRASGFPADPTQLAQAATTILWESKGCPAAWWRNTNPTTGRPTSTDYGIAQLNSYWEARQVRRWRLDRVHDVRINLRAWRQVLLERGCRVPARQRGCSLPRGLTRTSNAFATPGYHASYPEVLAQAVAYTRRR